MLNRKIIHLTTALILLLELLTGSPASAIMIKQDMDMLVTAAESVVSGQVVSLDMHWLDGPQSPIVTEVGLDIQDVLMGSKQKPGETIYFRIFGGQVGEITLYQEHQPTFKVGDEAILFLRVRSDGVLGIANAEQGVYLKHGEKIFGHLTELKTVEEFRSSLEAAKSKLGRR